MSRVHRSGVARARHRKIIAQAAGYQGRRKNVFRIAKQAVIKAGQYAYRDRRTRRRRLRALWVQRINAGARLHGLNYSRLVHGLKLAQVEVDRKLLADICVHDTTGFAVLCSRARAVLPRLGT